MSLLAVTRGVVKTEAVSGALSGLLSVADPVNYRNLYGQTSNRPFSTLPFSGQLTMSGNVTAAELFSGTCLQ